MLDFHLNFQSKSQHYLFAANLNLLVPEFKQYEFQPRTLVKNGIWYKVICCIQLMHRALCFNCVFIQKKRMPTLIQMFAISVKITHRNYVIGNYLEIKRKQKFLICTCMLKFMGISVTIGQKLVSVTLIQSNFVHSKGHKQFIC